MNFYLPDYGFSLQPKNVARNKLIDLGMAAPTSSTFQKYCIFTAPRNQQDFQHSERSPIGRLFQIHG